MFFHSHIRYSLPTLSTLNLEDNEFGAQGAQYLKNVIDINENIWIEC